ncbi:hypothetical protein [Oryza sativa Japonica Group]|uniref:Epstein-Barr virus EBNA-1-like protein n=1 Tax=Oryza sativa subsp. japonica TaxID=39947 RepID=Q5SMS4_ORYSJ|nr:hypothetical protein [Oryza sativa Japonica Group]BAD72482.1 hypothetical protein [Oryza sativa Japonica Group]
MDQGCGGPTRSQLVHRGPCARGGEGRRRLTGSARSKPRWRRRGAYVAATRAGGRRKKGARPNGRRTAAEFTGARRYLNGKRKRTGGGNGREEASRRLGFAGKRPEAADCGDARRWRAKGENGGGRRGINSRRWEYLRGSRSSSPALDGAERRRGDLATSGSLRERAATVASLWRVVARLGALSTRVREDYRATARAKGRRGQAGRENGGRHYRAETGAVTSGRQCGSELSGLGPGKGRKMGARSPASRVLARTGLPGARRRTATARAEEGRQWCGGVGV